MTMHDEYLSEGIFCMNLLNLPQASSVVRNRHLTWSFSLFIAGLDAFAFVPPMSLISPPSLPPCVHTFGSNLLWLAFCCAKTAICSYLPYRSGSWGFSENNWLNLLYCMLDKPLTYASCSLLLCLNGGCYSISKDIHKAILVRPKMHYLRLPECTGTERWCPAMLHWIVAVLNRELHWQML